MRPTDISRYLGRQTGYTNVERSVRKPGTGRNKPSWSAGYQVARADGDNISVRYTGGSHRSGSPDFWAKEYRKALDSLKTALEWDYKVEDLGSYLKVTGRKDTRPAPTSQGVSQFLGNAKKATGIERSIYTTTRVKGWGRWTEGYEVKKTYLGIEVDFTWSSMDRTEHKAFTREAKLEKLKEALEARYTVEYATRGMNIQVLIVTGLK